MALFQITNRTSGLDMGTYEADNFCESLDVMAYDAGYSDYADACRAIGQEPADIVADGSHFWDAGDLRIEHIES